MTKLKKISVVGLVTGLAVLGYFFIDDLQTKEASRQRVIEAKDELSKSGINAVKAHLNLYYVVNNEYPRKIDDLKEFVYNNPDTRVNSEKLQTIITSINNFSYEVRGDREAYKITYSDEAGNIIETEGNYNNEFH